MTFDDMFGVPMFLLAQENAGQAPVPGEPLQTTPGGTAPGNTTAPQGGSPPMGSNLIFIMILLFGGMIVWSIFAQRRDRKKREAMLGQMRKHDRVQTIGGVIGSVVEVKENIVVLKVDESTNTRITFARSAVQQILEETDKPGATGSPTELEASNR
jgi:preprotein translocase subunit YajC